MSYVYALAAATIMGCSVYMILSRNIVRMLLGLSLLATGANLLLFQTGRPHSQLPPLIAGEQKVLGMSADPVPQALILTAIVIGFALTLVLAALALRAWRDEGTIDMNHIHSAEGAPHSGPAQGDNE